MAFPSRRGALEIRDRPGEEWEDMYSVPPRLENSRSAVAGDNSNVVAGLCYVVGLVAVVLFFTEQRNRFVKFHSAQALIIHIAAIICTLLWMLIFLLIIVTGVAASIGTSSVGLLSGLAGLVVLDISILGIGLFIFYLAALIWGMIAAFTGKATRLPLAGQLAELLVGEWMPPRNRE